MAIKVDSYHIVLRFPRLFPDPVVFEDQKNLVRRYLSSNGVPVEKTQLIFQSTDEIAATDERGAPAATAGIAKYQFDGRTILAEYMSNANVKLDYIDFGTGLAPEEQSRLWSKGKIGDLRFELKDFKHNPQTLNVPDVSELYKILKEQATPSSLSTIELDGVPADSLLAVLEYVKARLKEWADADGLELEIYPARSLTSSEKAALQRRLTRESSESTVFVILSRPEAMLQPPLQ
jgi:hypothetical protein